MKLEKIDSSNERGINNYVESLIRQFDRNVGEKNKKGFEMYLSKLKKGKDFKMFEKLIKQNEQLKTTIDIMEYGLKSTYHIEIERSSYCSDDKLPKYKENNDYEYVGGLPTTKKNKNCNYQKQSQLSKAILEKNVAKVNELISELEEKAGVQ